MSQSDLLTLELREFSRGALAATLNVLLTFPLNKLIARQAYEGLDARAALRTVLDDARAATLFRGVASPLVQRGVAGGAMYASYDFWFHALRGVRGGGGSGDGDAPTALRAATEERDAAASLKIAAAFCAGSCEWALTPLERTQTLMQHRAHNARFPAGRDAVRAMFAAGGVREFYRGGSAILLRNGPANALYFSLRDAVSARLPAAEGGGGGGGGASALARDFVTGAILGAGSSTLLFPLHTVKVVMQLDVGGRFVGVLETGRGIVRERGGVRGLYRGVYLNALRSLISWGIINAAYEASGRLFA